MSEVNSQGRLETSHGRDVEQLLDEAAKYDMGSVKRQTNERVEQRD